MHQVALNNMVHYNYSSLFTSN